MPTEVVRISFNMSFEHPVKMWVLRLGGYLPIQFASASVLLIDQNIKSNLSKFQQNPNRSDLHDKKWWLDFLNSPSIPLNPILCAMEGRWRTLPTFEQFCEELRNTTQLLQMVLPRANVIQQSSADLGNLYEVLTSQAPRLEKEIAFLCAACPLIASRVASGNEHPVEVKILAAAADHCIPRQALPCIAALSALYEKTDGLGPLIGRKVLNPLKTYSANDAFNALSDMRALEFLAAGTGLLGRMPGLCTMDKHLAAFWVNLRIHTPTWSGNTFSASYNPKRELFPRLSDHAFQDLMDRLGLR